MKIFLAVLLVALCYVNADLSPEEQNEIHKIMGECQEKLQVSDEDVSLMLQHKLETQGAKCYAGCVMSDMGVLGANNTVNWAYLTEIMEKIKEKFGDNYEPIMKVFKTCSDENEGGADNCEVAASLMKCCVREIKANNIKVRFLNFL